ncbi:receptor-like protein EIX2 [Cryptomeria japonica]|uniref:receptor-like protein EIX2 n=1 Tax=Cryptomeria japonica TaxID=3369 RepID=UPI0027DA061E|nr:receptor-like protein EIX2 [Cryptomeria japonica]
MPPKAIFFVLCDFIQAMAVATINFAFISAAFIILSSNSCNGLFNCPTEESQALLSFKTALNVTDGIFSSWVNGSDCCSMWDGISCNNLTNHVEQVNLSAYTNHAEQDVQSGVISDLALPSSVRILWLSSITVSDTLFHNLAELNYLAFSDCVPNISTTSIPKFQLAALYLSSCSIGGRIPDWLSTQYSLQGLTLVNDNIVGEIPSWLWENNPQLIQLNISGNHFNGSLIIPNRSVPWMTLLDVSRNELTGQVQSLWPPYC